VRTCVRRVRAVTGQMRLFPALFVFGLGLAAASPTVTIANATRGGSTSFFDGDGYVVSISGAPANSPITLTQVRDGTIVGANLAEGNTDSSGNARFTGYVPGSEAGVVDGGLVCRRSCCHAGSLLHHQGRDFGADSYAEHASARLLLFNSSSTVDTATDLTGLPHLFSRQGRSRTRFLALLGAGAV